MSQQGHEPQTSKTSYAPFSFLGFRPSGFMKQDQRYINQKSKREISTSSPAVKAGERNSASTGKERCLSALLCLAWQGRELFAWLSTTVAIKRT